MTTRAKHARMIAGIRRHLDRFDVETIEINERDQVTAKLNPNKLLFEDERTHYLGHVDRIIENLDRLDAQDDALHAALAAEA
jgi:hypothetical protein